MAFGLHRSNRAEAMLDMLGKVLEGAGVFRGSPDHLLGRVQGRKAQDGVSTSRRRPRAGLDEVFLHRARTAVRKDNTVSFGGRRIEVTRMGMAGRKVELRFDPHDANASPKVYLDASFSCDTRPLELHANAHLRHRLGSPEPEPVLSTDELDPVGPWWDPVGDLLGEHFGTDFGRDSEGVENDR